MEEWLNCSLVEFNSLKSHIGAELEDLREPVSLIGSLTQEVQPLEEPTGFLD